MAIIRLSLICLIASAASAWAGPKIAVLEAIGPPGTPGERLMSWTDAVRGVVLADAPPAFIVLTRSNIEAFLPPGVALADCEGECEITTARKIGAEYVVGVRVTQTGSAWQITVALHATIDGRFLGQGRQSVPTEEIDTGLRAAATQAMQAIARVRPGPATTEASGQATIVHARPLTWMGAPILRIESGVGEPLIIHARGRRVGATPVNLLLDGETSLLVRAEAPGYRSQAFRVETGGASGETSLSLASTQANFTLDLPFDDVEVHVGGLSLQGRAHTVEAGTHRVQVVHPCLQAPAFEARLEAGDQVIEVPHTLTCGNIRLTSAIPGARVLWDGISRSLPFDGPIEPPRQRSVPVSAPGFIEARQTLTNPATGTTVVNVELIADWVDARVTMTRWTGEDCSAVVYIDGEAMGLTPWRGRVRSGSHRLSVTCDRQNTRSHYFRGEDGPVIIAFAEQGERAEVVLSSGAFNSSIVTLRGWTGPHRQGKIRASLGLSAGGFGYQDAPAGGIGLEVGIGVPLTHWLEIGGSLSGLIGSHGCSATERARKPSSAKSEDDCGHVYGEARGLLRVYLGRYMLEGGWAATGQTFHLDDRYTRAGPYLGVGLTR